MSSGIWSAASGAIGHLASLDVTANNLANASTAGFQGDRAVFQQVLAQKQLAGAASEYRQYSLVSSRSPDHTAGSITSTGKSLDVAINGDGYFVVKTPQGERYTRNGGFLVIGGQLSLAGGQRVLDEGRSPIEIPDNEADLRIGDDGTVYAGAEAVGQLAVVRFANPDVMQREGESLFRAPNGTAEATVPSLVTESLESSNVSVVKSMTELVTATRSFDAMQRMIDTFSEIERKAAMGIMGNR
ncbi:MAG: flagellar hook basal-body protein [Polyangiaceae bacterium]|nr:flagellar hook basal-body protein [Polyangiaceae bacterium]